MNGGMFSREENRRGIGLLMHEREDAVDVTK